MSFYCHKRKETLYIEYGRTFLVHYGKKYNFFFSSSIQMQNHKKRVLLFICCFFCSISWLCCQTDSMKMRVIQKKLDHMGCKFAFIVAKSNTMRHFEWRTLNTTTYNFSFFLCLSSSCSIHFFLFFLFLFLVVINRKQHIFPLKNSCSFSFTPLDFLIFTRSICLEYLCICYLLTLRQRNIKNKIKWEENRHKLEWISRTFNNCRWWYPAAKHQSSEKNFSMY